MRKAPETSIWIPKSEESQWSCTRRLGTAEKKLAAGVTNPHDIQRSIRDKIASEASVKLDYAEVVDLETLKPMNRIEAPALVAAAVLCRKDAARRQLYLSYLIKI